MGDHNEIGERVQLYVYDLSRGLARQFSPMLLGKQVDGIWHTSIVVGGMEFYYGQGISWSLPGQTPFGTPVQVIEMGVTQVPEEVREEFLVDLSTRFGAQHYDLLDNNCNNFSNELAQLLTGKSIPAHILSLPNEFRSSPLGAMLGPQISAMQAQLLANQGHQFSPAHPHAAAQAAAAERLSGGTTAAATPAATRAAAAATPAPVAVAGAAGTRASAIQQLGLAGGSSTPVLPTPVPAATRRAPAAAPGATPASMPPPAAPTKGGREGGGGGGSAGTSPAAGPLTVDKAGAAVQQQAAGVEARKLHLAAAIRREFDAIMAGGRVTANEAAALALKRVTGAGAK